MSMERVEAAVSSGAEHVVGRPGRTPVDEQVRRRGLRPLASLDELRAEVWESDDELEEFLAFLHDSRSADLA
jgi:hypothetical protein